MTGRHGAAGGSANRAAVSGPPAGPGRSARKGERKRVRSGTMSRIGRKDIVMNRFPLKHMADAAALAKVLARGDVIYGRPLSLGKRLDCLRFYFQTDGVLRLYAALLRSGTLWSELGMKLAIDLAMLES